MAINESLGIEDGGITEQLNAIKLKNQELEKLNKDLVTSQIETQETLNLLEKTVPKKDIYQIELVRVIPIIIIWIF